MKLVGWLFKIDKLGEQRKIKKIITKKNHKWKKTAIAQKYKGSWRVSLNNYMPVNSITLKNGQISRSIYFPRLRRKRFAEQTDHKHGNQNINKKAFRKTKTQGQMVLQGNFIKSLKTNAILLKLFLFLFPKPPACSNCFLKYRKSKWLLRPLKCQYYSHTETTQKQNKKIIDYNWLNIDAKILMNSKSNSTIYHNDYTSWSSEIYPRHTGWYASSIITESKVMIISIDTK